MDLHNGVRMCVCERETAVGPLNLNGSQVHLSVELLEEAGDGQLEATALQVLITAC